MGMRAPQMFSGKRPLILFRDSAKLMLSRSALEGHVQWALAELGLSRSVMEGPAQ